MWTGRAGTKARPPRDGGALEEWLEDCQESGLEAKRVRGVQVDHGEGTG